MARALGLGPRGREFESHIPDSVTNISRILRDVIISFILSFFSSWQTKHM